MRLRKLSAILCLSLFACSFEGFNVKAADNDENIIETPLAGEVTTTISASESVEYQIPKNYKGRIVIRYYQDQYTFTCYKSKNGKIISSKSGYAWSRAYDPYYARQLLTV